MDIFAHGLWAAAAYKAADNKLGTSRRKKKLNIKAAALWGIFPDLFAFFVPWVLILVGLFQGSVHVKDIPGPDSIEPPPPGAFPPSIFNLALSLYNISHSLFVFAVVVFAVWLMRKRIPWEMGGWLLHILIDIPTHSYAFFSTPFLWPLSGWKFSHGIAWSNTWFMLLNYAALVYICWILFVKSRLAARRVALREKSHAA